MLPRARLLALFLALAVALGLGVTGVSSGAASAAPTDPHIGWCKAGVKKFLRHANRGEFARLRVMTFERSDERRMRTARRDGLRFDRSSVRCRHASDMPEGFSSSARAINPTTGERFVFRSHADTYTGDSENYRVWDVRIREAAAMTLAEVAASERARRWHRLNLKCRGGSGDSPATQRACHQRDALTRQVGKEFVGRFHTAWKRNNRSSMRRMVKPSARSMTMPMLRGRASQTARDCDYGTGAHYCYFRETSGAWTGVQFKVVRIAPRRLPIWRVTGAAPDGV